MDPSSSAAEFEKAVGRWIDAHALLADGCGVLVAFSGGPDSLALLATLGAMAPRRKWRVEAAHLDHAMRPDSARDARRACELAQDVGVACYVGRVDVPAAAARSGRGLEEQARQARYAFLAERAQAAGLAKVAVGHHAGDQVETIIHRFFRGTHLHGLAGMPVRRPLCEGVDLVRPLLAVGRDDIERYLEARGLRPLHDPSNRDVGFTRNFIRHDLLPRVEARLNPRAAEAILRVGEAAREAAALLEVVADEALAAAGAGPDWDRQRLAELPATLRTVALRRMLHRCGASLGAVTAVHLRELAGRLQCEGRWEMPLPGGTRVLCQGGRVDVRVGRPDEEPIPEAALPVPGLLTLPAGASLRVDRLRRDHPDVAAHLAAPAPGVEVLDADSVAGRLTVRPRRPGDRFVPLGAGGHQSVSDFLTNARLGPTERAQAFCVCDEAGIVAVMPLRIADRVRVTPQTRRILRLAIVRDGTGADR